MVTWRCIRYIPLWEFFCCSKFFRSRYSFVRVDRRLEADRVKTSPRRSSVSRTTEESKDVDVPPSHFKNSVASVYAVGWRRSSICWLRCWSRPTSLLLRRGRRRPTRNQSDDDALRDDTFDFDESLRTSDLRADGRRQGEMWRHRYWLYDVTSTC